MQKVARKLKDTRAIKGIQHYTATTRKKLVNLPRGMKRFYTKSLTTAKEHPYQTTGVLLGLGTIAGALIWFGIKRKEY